MLLRARGISAARWGHRSVAGVSVRNFVNQAVTAAGLVQPLEGCTVVALEQAVAAPFSTSRLADAGARVIKIERNDDKGILPVGTINLLVVYRPILYGLTGGKSRFSWT